MFKTGISLLALLAATPALAEDADEIVVTALGIEQPTDEVERYAKCLNAPDDWVRNTYKELKASQKK